MENTTTKNATCLNQIIKINQTLDSIVSKLYPVILSPLKSEGTPKSIEIKGELIEELDVLYYRISDILERISI